MASCVNKNTEEFKALAEQSNINPIILAAKVSLWQEKNGLDKFPTTDTLFQLRDERNIEPAIKELDNYLLDFMKPFGVRSKEFDELKSKLGVDALGATDVLNKLIWYTKNRNAETIPEEVGHMATMLMGENHPDIKDLLSEIENWSEYQEIYDKYMPIYNNEKQVKIEAIGKLIAKSLVKNYKESGFDKTLLQKALDVITKFINNMLTTTNIGDVLQYNSRVADHIALNILAGNKNYIANLKPATEKLNYKQALEGNPFAQRIINFFTSKNMKLTGSIAIAGQGEDVYRSSAEPIHDIDFNVNSFDDFANIQEDLMNMNAEPYHYGWDNKQKDYKTFAFLIPKKGFRIEVLARDFERGNGWVTNYNVLNEKGEIVKPTSQNHLAVDFFVYKNGQQANTNSIFKSFADIYFGKITLSPEGNNERMFKREKDQADYVLSKPKNIVETDKAFRYLQSEDMPASKASEETVAMMREAAEQMGIDIQDLLDYAKANPSIDVKNVNGLADLMKGAVAVAQGKEGVALVEEIVHITTAILEQTDPKLITELISKIDRFKIYKQVLAVYSKKKEYQLANGKPNIRKIKKEAVDKLISEVVVYQSEGSTEYPELMEEETRNMIQRLWDMILDKLRSVYRKSNIDIFQTAGTIVKSGKAGTVADIKTEGIYLQLDDTVKNKIENYFNKVKDYAKEMVYNPEIKDASGNITQKRGYTFKGEPVATTITEKIKKNKKFPERTPEQKASDDEKKDWGDAGHAFQQNDLETNFIDKATGLAYATPLNNTITSTLPLDIQKQLHNFNRELIASYPAGTRFLVEEMVVNTKEKGMIGSRVDFKAIYPVQKKDGTWDMKIDTLDWKFTTVDKTLYDDISRDKIKDWVPQMGQFVAIDYTYGANQTQIGKARMIPFILNYNYKIAGDKKSGLYPESMEVGKLNSLEETNLYLLPVPIITETTGNEAVDKLVVSLQAQWDKLWNKKTPFAEKDKKIADLAELSKAIRFLHLKIDFEPLVNVGKTFLNNAADTLKEFNNIKFAELNDVELDKKLKDLISYKEGAKKYADLGDTFLSYYPRKTLTKEGQKILDDLTNISRSTDNMLKEIDKLQKQFVVELAKREKFTTEDTELSVLDAEASIVGMSKSFLESSKLSSMIINLTTNLIMVAKKVVDGKVRKQIKQFGDALIPLEKEARARGVKAFDMIATKSKDGMSLIKKINPDFWVKVNKAKENKDKKFFLDNVNLDEYNALAKTAIEQRIIDASKRQYASDPETNERYKQYAIDAINNALNLTSDSFNGYNDKTFGYLFSKSFKQDKNYSKEYIEMSKSKAALDVWNIFTKLNERAEGMGYLGEYKDSFFPLIEATILEKFYQTSSITGQTKDFFQDFYKIKVNEEQQFSKNDPETGKVKLVIPKLFTKTDKAIEQLSTDLNKVGTLWIKSIEEYENKKNLESQLLTLHSIEAAKGSLVMENGRAVIEAGVPKVNLDENKNADLLKVIINDYLYNLTENQNSLGNITISAAASKLGKTEEGAEKVEVATKKIIATADTWVQSLAVGLKPAIAIANWFGNQFTAYIQAGGFYNFWTDFEKNNIKVTTGKLTTVERGLLDLIHPLNEDVTQEERRSIAWKQGYVQYLSTWSFTDVMQITNSFPERKLQYANALSFIDNSIVIDGEIKNIRKYLKAQDRITRKGMSESERKTLEKSFESRVTELKNAPNALKNIAKIEDGEMVIPGVSDLNVAKFSLTVSEYARTLNGQMSLTNKADYRRDTMFSSFMMFKNWIPKLVTARGMDIKKNVELDTWEYGRTRAFFKTVAFLGKSNISSMIDIINGTDKGLKILDELLEAKKLEHYKRTGQELDITQEEFYDLMREQLQNQVKELKLLIGLLAIVFAAAAAEPPEDATDAEKNAYKWYSKVINKISDEVSFYYNPISFESITKGSLLPSVGLLSKALIIVDQVSTEGYGIATDNEDMMDKAHGLKYILNIIPGLSQAQNEVLPYLYPELAKDMGIRVSKEARSR